MLKLYKEFAFLTKFIRLIQELKNIIYDLRVESTQFNVNDVLVNVESTNKNLFFSSGELNFSLEHFPKKILSETNKLKKESGVNALCSVNGIVSLTIGEKAVLTPVFLTPLEFKVNKVNQTISFEKLEDEIFINPFLIFHLSNKLEIDVSKTNNLSEFVVLLGENDLSIIDEDKYIIGNFHHHRYQIIKELDELIEISDYSTTLKTLLGFKEKNEVTSIELVRDNLFFADTDHEKVFESVRTSDTVIQGPPGTGKSQVLSNLLGKIVSQNKTTIVLSEKRAALEVLKKKLSTFSLDQLCFIATSDHLSHSFFEELKATWNYFENYSSESKTNILLSEQYVDQLQMILDLLRQESLIGGVSFSDFFKESASIDLSAYSYNSRIDSIDDYRKNKSIIEWIYNEKLNNVVGNLKHSTINSSEFNRLDKKIETWIDTISTLQKTFSIEDWIDLQKITKEAIQCQIFENEYYRKYSSLFQPNSKVQKTFLRLRKKYMKSKIELEKIQNNNSHWKVFPSEIETISLLEQFEEDSFFKKIKTKKRWKSISYLPIENAVEELKSHLKNIEKINNFTQLTIEFCELGVDNPEIDIEQIYQTLTFISEEEWLRLFKIPLEQRLKITSSHQILEGLQRDFRTYLNLDNLVHILSFLNQLKNSLGQLITSVESLKKLSQNTLNNLKINDDFNSFEGQLYTSHYTIFKERFPDLANFSISELFEKVNGITQLQLKEQKDFAQIIEASISNKFKAYHELLSTSSRKLSEDQKVLKNRLRKGKSILVKEFSKTRSHPSLREIYNSEAREWIVLLKPIWLSNPSQLSKCFPMENSLFDFAIFDEASQIPIQNALGAIQRSKRIIVAGDEHQMGPSSYFKSGSKEPMDLLHQASFHLNKIPLSHHYRSKHPDLIAFSNKHIYKGQLKAFPSFNSKSPINHFYCGNGVFKDRQNEVEAKVIAKSIEPFIKSDKNIGVVAFSEEQLNCIWKQFSSELQEQLLEKVENNSAFFKALENVQGNECDELFISFGYGKNEEGDFHMRFGPMNSSNGRKRLNVLVTRAKESISFFCSVKTTDFKLSDNESINLLRQWFQFSESYKENSEFNFPYQLQPEQQNNKLIFSSIHEYIGSAKELTTLQNVLKERGWKITYC